MTFEVVIIGAFFMFFLFIIATFAFWIWMIIDCVQRDFKDKNEKVVWILILLFVQVIGAIVYYFVVKKEDKKRRKKHGKK